MHLNPYISRGLGIGGEGGMTQALPSPFGSPSLCSGDVSRFALGSNRRGFSPSSFFKAQKSPQKGGYLAVKEGFEPSIRS
jgi:hypothetical protein